MKGSHKRTLCAGAVCAVFLLAGCAGPVSVIVVDQAAPGASDSNPGTEERPFKTVQRGLEAAQPGDTVCVMAGRYDERAKVNEGGAPGKPIVIRAVPRRSAVVAGFDLAGASHVRIEGFEITAEEPQVAVKLGGHHCEVIDNYIHHMRRAVEGTSGKPIADGKKRDYSAVTHNRVAYNKVYHTEYGFILGGEDWLVENNEVSRLFMYSEGKRYDDCDYTRFFGKNAVQRYNYYHGTNSKETKVAHVDGIQTFAVNGECAENLLFEYNAVFDWGQGCMVTSSPNVGNVRNFTLRRNIFSSKGHGYDGAWGVNLVQVPDVTVENNTFASIVWYGAGLRGKESTGGRIVGNICYDVAVSIADRKDGQAEGSNPLIEYNLSFKARPPKGERNVVDKDPMFVDADHRDYRLRKGSPAIGAGLGGATIGALEYPNVYYVDPRHPAAADEPPWGYPAVPLASVAKALSVAEPGESIVLRGGVYRETIAPQQDDVTILAMKGETVVVSGADLIQGWQRKADGWSAPLAARPKQVLRDGKPWTEFAWDAGSRRINVATGGDPRLHVFETVVRETGLALGGHKGVRVEDVEIVNTLGDAITGAENAALDGVTAVGKSVP